MPYLEALDQMESSQMGCKEDGLDLSTPVSYYLLVSLTFCYNAHQPQNFVLSSSRILYRPVKQELLRA